MTSNNPLLYSYRRCPYAMRARMALVSAQIQCEVIEVDFKNKPEYMLEISPKGTVPVLETAEGKIIDESLDIVYWALSQNDPDDLMQEGENDLIQENDGTFKGALDRYKYPNRFPDEDFSGARDTAQVFLEKLNASLEAYQNLLGDKVSIADIAIFPFIRQCANVDREWFDDLPYKPLQLWLDKHIENDLFQYVFKKQADSSYLLITV